MSSCSEMFQFLKDFWHDVELVEMTSLKDAGNWKHMEPDSLNVRCPSLLSPLFVYLTGARFSISGYREFDHGRVKAWIRITVVSTVHGRIGHGQVLAIFSFTILTWTVIGDVHRVDQLSINGDPPQCL